VPPLTADDAKAGVLDRFRDVVAAQPDAVAVTDSDRELSFGRLAAEAAAALAELRRVLAGRTPRPEPGGAEVFHSREPVAVLHGHHTGAVAALLAVIASGHPVLVLDTATPAPRLRQFVERAGARLVLVDPPNQALAAELFDVPTAELFDVPTAEARADGTVVVLGPDLPAAPADLLLQHPPDPATAAALAFTSGSTGRPKLVANDHRLLVRDAWNSSIATDCYGADDVIAHTLPMAFHAGLTTTVHGLLVGATMRLYDARSHGIAGLPSWIAQAGATVMITSPGILRAFVATGPDPALLAGLRTLTVAGEAAYGGDVATARAVLPAGCVIRHRYGSSETGLIAEYPISADHPALAGAVPAGRGAGATRLDLVDERGRPAPAGDTGWITVTAPSVALGYWADPEATASAFTDHLDGTRTYRSSDLGRFLPDGNLQIIGRADFSVKIRGYLVDPGEIDAALFGLDDVREAVVVSRPRGPDGGVRLVAYVVSAAERPSAAAIRAALRDRLPGHMVPETVVFLERLPRTERGKIDRDGLPPPPAPPAAVVVGLTHWETLVARIWADVLGLDQVGLDDDFFVLGGDSLAAEALISRLVATTTVPPELATTRLLAEAPVLRDFAARLLQHVTGSGRGTDRVLVPLHPAGSRLPLFLVAGGGGLGAAFVPWGRRLGPDQPTWALQSPVLEGRGLPDRSVRALARRYLSAVRRVQPNGPYQLGGHSFGGLVALEMAHQLDAAGERVQLLIILDSYPPDPAEHPIPEPLPLRRRARTTAGLWTTALRSTPGGAQSWRFFDASAALGRRYRCRPWPGRTLVVVADTPEQAQRSRWEPFLTGRWRRVQVGGDHITMTRPPWSDEVADVIRAALDEAATDS
jgi:acyl-coenzyme A synthetase/AMP-(fatty) acid ligase/thioesterase domain-containing protein